MNPRDYTDVDAMYEARTARDETFDDFDSEVQHEEVDDGADRDDDWEGADAEMLTGAGWGTSEDYCCFGGDDW